MLLTLYGDNLPDGDDVNGFIVFKYKRNYFKLNKRTI